MTMNRCLFTILATFACVGISFAQSQSDEFAQVSKVLNYYLVGGTNNDLEMLSQAFHENATMKFISSDGYKEVNAIAFFRKGMKSGPAQDRKTSIESIEIAGNAAQARLKIEYGTFFFHDYMQLLKIDGEWKVTSKIFYKENK